MNFHRIAAVLAAGIAVAAASPAEATTVSTPTPITINAKVTSTCTISTDKTTYSIASYDTTSAQTTPASVSVKCTKGTPFTVTVGAGGGAGKTASARAMARADAAFPGGFEYLGYDIVDPNNSNATVTTTASQTAKGINTANTFPLTITVPASQDVTIGDYTDSVTVQVDY